MDMKTSEANTSGRPRQEKGGEEGNIYERISFYLRVKRSVCRNATNKCMRASWRAGHYTTAHSPSSSWNKVSSNVNKCKPEVPLQLVPSWLGVQEVNVSPDKVVVESPRFSKQWSTYIFLN